MLRNPQHELAAAGLRTFSRRRKNDAEQRMNFEPLFPCPSCLKEPQSPTNRSDL